MDEQRPGTPPFWDCPDCGRELDWNEETLTWCDECGAEWRYGEDEPTQSENEVR